MTKPQPADRQRLAGAYLTANVMTLFQEIILSIAIAMCAFAISKTIWSALTALL
jgi:hypothetical protein